MADLTFGIRITADGQASIVETRRVRDGLDDIGDGAKRASGALSTMGSVLGALQLDRLISETVAAARESIRFAASLDDLADTTGSTVENLSGLANMAKFSGTSFGLVETAIAQMSRRLSAADDDSKRMGAAMRLLGVEARDPALAFNEIAQKLNQYADGANKVALAQELFGRSGAQLLPLLKDIAREQEVGVRLTREHAEAAEQFQKNWAAMALAAQGFLQQSLLPLIKGFNDYVAAVRIAKGEGLGFLKSDQLASMSPEQADRRIGEVLAKISELRGFIDGANGLQRFIGATNRWTADLREAERELAALQKLAAKFNSGNEIDIRPAAPTVAGRSKAQRDNLAYETEMLRIGRELNEELKEREKLRKKQQEAEEKLAESIRRVGVEAASATAAEAKRLQAQSDSIDAYERETEAIGKTREQVAELTIKRLEEQKAKLLVMEGTEAYIALLDKEIAAIKRRVSAENAEDSRKASLEAAKAAEEEWRRTSESIGNTITDALMRGFESGKDAARNLRDSLVNMFKTLVLRPIIQAVMAPVAGGIAGLLGSGSASAGGGLAGGGSPWLNLAGSFLGGGNTGGGLLGGLFGGGGGQSGGLLGGLLGNAGGGTLWGSSLAGGGIFSSGLGAAFATSAVGQGLGLSVAMGAGEGVALTALGSTLGMAVPIIGFALAIAAALGAFDRGGPKTGGSASNIPGFGRFFTPNQGDTEMQAMVSASAQAYEQIIAGLGGRGTAGFAYGFDDDPEGDAQSRISVAARVNGQDVYQINDREVGGDMEDVKKQLEIESKRALLAALQASEMPSQIARVMNSITASAASASQIDTVVAFGTAMNTALQAAKPGVGQDAAKAYEQATQSVTARLRTMGTELQRLAKEQDGSVGKMQALAAATAQYRQSVAETLIAIKQIGATVQAMLAQTRESIEFAGLDNQAAYNLARERGNALAAAIAESEDPAQVQQLAERINAYLMQAFGLLSPEEQLARKPEFLEGLTTLDNAVATALARIGVGIEEATTDPFAAVNEALDSASVKFEAAADAQQSAASVFGDAVDTFGEHVAKLQNLTIRLDGGGAVGPAYGGGG